MLKFKHKLYMASIASPPSYSVSLKYDVGVF
jgi:hypothetical protein